MGDEKMKFRTWGEIAYFFRNWRIVGVRADANAETQTIHVTMAKR
jgi:hypothetical protein